MGWFGRILKWPKPRGCYQLGSVGEPIIFGDQNPYLEMEPLNHLEMEHLEDRFGDGTPVSEMEFLM